MPWKKYSLETSNHTIKGNTIKPCLHPSNTEWSYNYKDITKEYKDSDRKGFVASVIADIVGDLDWATEGTYNDKVERLKKVIAKWKTLRKRSMRDHYSLYLKNKEE